jgi:hypothetical protein
MARRTPKQTKVAKGIIQMHEGIWYALASHELTECCHCGLVHETEYKFQGRHIFWRAKIHRKATRAARKREGVTIVKSKPRS